MDIKNPEGMNIPDRPIRIIRDEKIVSSSTSELFNSRRVILFGLPGAFTPTCSNSHVPRFNQLASLFREHGVDEIVCLSVNDIFVMSAWKKDQHADRITFLADGNGDLAQALGLLVDRSDVGFGPRSWRFSLLVQDGVVEKAFIEPQKPGDPFEVSDADTLLAHVAPGAKPPHDILMLVRRGCGHCSRARAALKEARMDWQEVEANLQMLRAVSQTPTAPRVFIDGRLIGGAEELIVWLAQNKP